MDYNRNLRNDYEFARLDSSITNNLRVSGTFTYSPQREHGQIPSYTTSAPPSNDFSQLGGRVAANNVTGSGVWTPTAKLVISARFGRNYLNEKDSSYGVPAGPRIHYLNRRQPCGYLRLIHVLPVSTARPTSPLRSKAARLVRRLTLMQLTLSTVCRSPQLQVWLSAQQTFKRCRPGILWHRRSPLVLGSI